MKRINLENAVDYVKAHGNAVEKARLQFIIANEAPGQDIVDDLFQGQRADGGWSPFWAGDYTSLDATCFRLAKAEQIGLTVIQPAYKRAIQFLLSRQSMDGSWEEDAKMTDMAPPWVKPGELNARLYLTANCGFWLALSGVADREADKAAGYLETHPDEHGRIPGFWHTHWLAGALWYSRGLQENARRVFGLLSQEIEHLGASNLAWLITTLGAAGVMSSHPLIVEAASLLEQNQLEDGRWQSEDGPSQDVHATLESLRALSYCGRL